MDVLILSTPKWYNQLAMLCFTSHIQLRMKAKIETTMNGMTQVANKMEEEYNKGVVDGFSKESWTQVKENSTHGLAKHLPRCEEALTVLYQEARSKPDPQKTTKGL